MSEAVSLLRREGELNESQTSPALAWIEVAERAPYFVTDAGEAWTPIGQNDAVTWPELAGCFRRRDLAGVDKNLANLAAHGVTVLRLMLEYCHGEHRYFERPAGRFQPNMIRLWDDLFALCEKHKLRILLTPFDTFWMWIRWRAHPYNEANGGPCARRAKMLVCPEARRAIKERLAFATERWGGSGALFAWDLWNEIHTAYAEDCAAPLAEFIEDVGGFLRETEVRLHGRAHPQTVSVFHPHLESDPCIGDAIFRHPALDFASTHFYEHGTINNPGNTVDAAISVGKLTRASLAEIADLRPFFDSEHGPIHTFKDHRRTLSEEFDDEYFRHIQWAHFASGGAGGGMRWPNRHPHALTGGMSLAQKSLAGFLPLIEWRRFRRTNWNDEVETADDALARFACGDEEQAIVWLLRADRAGRDGKLRPDAEASPARIRLPPMRAGRYRITAWDTRRGTAEAQFDSAHTSEGKLILQTPPFAADLALAVRRVGGDAV